MRSKSEWRSYGKELLKQLNANVKGEKEKRIYEHVFSSLEWRAASSIGCTISQVHEIDTTPIIEKAWDEGKRVVVPKCTPTEHILTFYEIQSFQDLESVYFGLQEPIVENCERCEPKDIDLMLVPGLIFSKKGYRIGYGGGYYDRYLATYEHKTIAIATEDQLVEEVPFNQYDIPVQQIVTEEGFKL